jgi:hypothetical protein
VLGLLGFPRTRPSWLRGTACHPTLVTLKATVAPGLAACFAVLGAAPRGATLTPLTCLRQITIGTICGNLARTRARLATPARLASVSAALVKRAAPW